MNKKRGFALIELLVVVLIIGILAAVALPQYQKAVNKSRYVQVITMADNIAKGVYLYHMANGTYPTALDELDITLPGTLSANKTRITYNDYTCYFTLDTMNSVLCRRGDYTDPQFLGYRIFFGGTRDGQRYCLAKSGNNAMANFCVSMGGKNPFDNGDALMHYQL